MTTARFIIPAIAFALLSVVEGAANPLPRGSTTHGLLYLTDSAHGRIYTYDPTSHEAPAASLLSIGQPAAGAITFHDGIGYVAVGATGSNRPGLYRFKAFAPAQAATRIGEPVSAQFIDVASASKGYVTVASYVSVAATRNGVYTFDPAKPAGGLQGPIAGTTTAPSGITTYPQGIVTGPDSMIYVADYRNGKVMQIDPSNDSVTRIFTTSARGTSGLAVGSFEGASGVLVANEGAFDARSGRRLPGSVDFIDTSTGVLREVTSAISGASGRAASIHPARLLMVSPTSIIATGVSQTLLISASDGSTSMLLARGAPFGGSDIALADGTVFIAAGNFEKRRSEIYAMSPTGAQLPSSPATVMRTGEDCIADLAYEK